MEKLFGLPASKIIGKRDDDLFDKEAASHIREVDSRVLKGEIVEEEHTKKIKRISFTFHVIKVPLRDDSGEVIGFCGIARDITERKRAEKALCEAEERFRTIVETASSLLMISDAEGNNLYVSPNCEEITGYTQEELRGEQIWWVHEDDTPRAKEVYDRIFREEVGGKNFEYKIVKKNGEVRYASSSWEPLKDEEGKFKGIVSQTIDITERKRAEDKIKASLKEKEVLLREIHHRVKNNLQIISSLLNMQARKAKDKNVIDSLLDSRSRIQTMSLIHAQLYQSENLERIEMDVTIRKMVSFLLQIYAKEKKNITSVVTAEGVILSISQAIPCGLIINELVSNALKHAFKGMTEGRIEISMRELADDRIELTVKDNGVGIPEEIDIYKTDTLGLKIVRTLAEEQLKGKMGLIRDEGTEIYVQFDKSMTN